MPENQSTQSQDTAEKPAAEFETELSTSTPEQQNSEPKAPQASATAPASSKGKVALTLSIVCLVLLVLASVGLYGLWSHYQTQQQAQQERYSQQLKQLEKALSENQRQQTQLLRSFDALSQQQQQKISQLIAQFNELESSQRALRQMNQSPPEQWVLAEVNYLIQLAGQRLWVESDIQTATSLLVSADERIAGLHDARLVPLRRALADDIQSLKSLPKLDIDGIVFTLDSLIEQLDQLPIRKLEIPESITTAQPQEISENPAEWQQNLRLAWEHFVDGFIKVEQRVSGVEPLLSPKQSWHLVQNSRLMLQQAQLAALRAQPQHYQNSLSKTHNWLAAHFEADNAQVKSTQQALAKLMLRPVQLDLPKSLKSRALAAELLSQPLPTEHTTEEAL